MICKAILSELELTHEMGVTGAGHHFSSLFSKVKRVKVYSFSFHMGEKNLPASTPNQSKAH